MSDSLVKQIDNEVGQRFLMIHNYHSHMKKCLGVQHFVDEEHQIAVASRLRSLMSAFYAEGIGKLVERYEMA